MLVLGDFAGLADAPVRALLENRVDNIILFPVTAIHADLSVVVFQIRKHTSAPFLRRASICREGRRVLRVRVQKRLLRPRDTR